MSLSTPDFLSKLCTTGCEELWRSPAATPEPAWFWNKWRFLAQVPQQTRFCLLPFCSMLPNYQSQSSSIQTFHTSPPPTSLDAVTLTHISFSGDWEHFPPRLLPNPLLVRQDIFCVTSSTSCRKVAHYCYPSSGVRTWPPADLNCWQQDFLQSGGRRVVRLWSP